MIKPKIISPQEEKQRQVQALLDGFARQSTRQEQELFLVTALNSQAERWLAKFITDDEKMLEVKQTVRRLANIPDPVLITGPSGTGKELIARALHGEKDPKDFYAINMAAMPEGLIESELFGHMKGAFTSATNDNPGILRAAGDGTVFLDEIGEAPMHLQAKLLRVLQPDINNKRWVRPVGGINAYPIECRIIAATKVNLFEAVDKGTFREDLYGRLMTFEVTLTSLFDRPADKLPILHSLGCDDLSEIDTPYWQDRIQRFNVRALQAYARRQAIL